MDTSSIHRDTDSVVLYMGVSHIAGPLMAAVCLNFDKTAIDAAIPDRLKNQQLQCQEVFLQKVTELEQLFDYQTDLVLPATVDSLGVRLAQNRLKERLLSQYTPVSGDWKVKLALRFLLRQTYYEHMLVRHEAYPHYGWDKNLGNGTDEHYTALVRYGPVPSVHRWHALRLLPSWIYRNQHRVGRHLPAWWRKMYNSPGTLLDYVQSGDFAIRRNRVRTLHQKRSRHARYNGDN